MAKLNHPTLFCHNLSVDKNGLIGDYCLRLKDHKRKAVEAFKALNFKTFAAGDSYNDLSMIDVAEYKALFCPPKQLIKERPDLEVALTHEALKSLIQNIL